MRLQQEAFELRTAGRGSIDIGDRVAEVIAQSNIGRGLCHVFVHHTSASLMLCENADPTVREDLERFMGRLAPDADPLFRHDQEGPDDMPAHVRTLLTGSGLVIPVTAGRLALGTWQGIYLWEHRQDPHRRRVTVTVLGGR